MSGSAVTAESNSEISVMQLTNGIEIVDATISPDGKYFVYHEPDGDLNRIWLQQTGHSSRVEIVPASTRLPLSKTFTPDGQFVYFLAVDAPGEPASLYRVPTLGGPVTKILSGLVSGVSFSPDGRQMVFQRSDKNGTNVIIGASDGSGNERVLYSAATGIGTAAWAPDGISIAIALQADASNVGGGCYVAVVDSGTGALKRFSDEIWAICGRMEWAADGRGLYMIGTRKDEGMTPRRDQVFYISYPNGRSRKITADGSRHQLSSLGVTKDGAVLAVPYSRSSQIWSMDPNGDRRTAVQLTTGLADGRSGIAPMIDSRVAYISRVGENLNVWVMNQDGSDQKQLTDIPYPIEELRSGGDGRFLTFSAYVDPDHPHLYRINKDGTALQQLTSGEGREIDSSVSNDGKWIAYASATNSARKFELSLWKQSLDSGERVSLNRSDCQMPHFSPDDKYISCVKQQMEILVLSSVDGRLVSSFRVPQSSTISHTLNFGSRWTPDGRSLMYIANDKGVSNIWLQPVDGSPSRRLTDFTSGSIYHFAYSLDGTRLFLARGNQIRDAILIKNSTN
jgi:Tol biopolymer transport system component